MKSLQLNIQDSLNCQPSPNEAELPWTLKPDFLSSELADQWLLSSEKVDWQQNTIQMFGKQIDTFLIKRDDQITKQR